MNRNISLANALVTTDCPEKVPGISMIETWDTFVKDLKVVPDLYLDQSSVDDIHISTKGKVALGQLWADKILQIFN